MLGTPSLLRFASLALLSTVIAACNGAVETSTPTPSPAPTGSGTGTGTGTTEEAPPSEGAPGLTNTPPTKVGDPRGGGTPFHIVLSNQSFDVPLVDLRVSLDGFEVVRGDFPVGSQHSFYTFDFSLAPGAHQIQVASSTGQAVTSTTVTVEEGKERWGISMYWNQGCGASLTGGEPCTKKLDWMLTDTRPYFD